MSAPHLPPAFAESLLRRSIANTEWRDAVSGDLREEYADLARRRGVAVARRWYWRQALGLALRFSTGRLIPMVAPRRPMLAPDPDTEWHSRWTWLNDGRHALRALAARPALAGAVILTLALALAANATIFNLADALYLRPFRFAGVDRLVVVASAPENDPLADRSSVAPADYREWVEASATLTDFAAADFWDPNLSEIDEPQQLAGFRVTPGFFRAIRATPALGRTFLDEEAVPGADRRVVLSHGLWRRRFGGDPTLVGRHIRLNGEPHEVVGIMQPGPSIPYGAELWAPLAYTEEQWRERRRGWLLVVARLGGGQSVGTARAEMEAIVARQRQAFPDTHASREVAVSGFIQAMRDEGAGPFLAIWQAAAILLLLIASANIANLLMARGTERQQEFAVRLALGASRWRLALQVMFEGAWLAALSIALALPLAAVGVSGMRRGLPPSVLRWVAGYEFMHVDWVVLGVTALLGAAATLFFSLMPALQASRAAVSDSLRQGGRTSTASRGRRWLGTALAAGQVALTLALVVGSALILGAVDAAVNGVLGFDKREVMTARLTLPERPYVEPEARRQFLARVMDRMRGMPAVESLAAVTFLPYAGASSSRPIHPEGAELTPAEARPADFQRATPAYFETMRIPVLEGRGLTEADREDGRQVAVVSRSFADRYWPGVSAVGRRFRVAPEAPWIEVVGVSGDIMHDWFMNQRRPTFYRPYAQDPALTMAIVVRTTGNPLDVAGELRRAVTAADPDQPILELRSMEQVIADKLGGVTYLARALAAMGSIALLLALMGVYSLIAYLAARRTQEIGVRIALGATRWQVIALNIRQALVITGLGLAVGTVLAVALGRVMTSALFGLVSLEPLPVAAMVVALGLTALAAGYLPARKAADLDPTTALRTP
ncbi:MAG: ABC transporter permease [Acidobacteria bacterium]|nr:ABC transporter permease [Acidobacteriota bacterium]